MKSGAVGSMKSLAGEIEKLKFDKRLTELEIKRKRMTKEELKKYVDALPDLADNVAKMDLDEKLN